MPLHEDWIQIYANNRLDYVTKELEYEFWQTKNEPNNGDDFFCNWNEPPKR